MELREIGERKRNLDYDQSLKNPIYLQMNAAVKSAKEFFDSIPKSGLSIYDFGCGAKPYQVFVGTNDYIGIDIDKKNQQAEIFSSVDKVPVENSVADIVCSFFVLEHVYNTKDVLKEKFRLLKSGGRLFMHVPLYWEEHEMPYDYFRFTQFGLRTMLEEVGFDEIEIKPINANWSIFGMHLSRMLSGRRLTRVLVPLFNYLFSYLDKRSLQRTSNQPNVMSYEVKALKNDNKNC